MAVLSGTLIVVGAACILYCVGILLFTGRGAKFFLVWGAGGICLIVAGQTVRIGWFPHMPVWAMCLLAVLAGLFLLCFLVTEALILSGFGVRAPAGADFLIVLGAQMKRNGPSEALVRRLDVAATYLKENPGTTAIVSGGKGKDEIVSEARGMCDYLTKAGVGADRILLEDTSVSTYENLTHSSSMLSPEKDLVVIVTNNFHMYRALRLAKKLGFVHVCGLAASSHPFMLPNNLLREFFCVIKEVLTGRI